MSLILVSEHNPLLSIIKILSKEGHKFACLGSFAKTLTDLDIPARSLADASQGLQDRAFWEASQLLYQALGTPGIHMDGLGPGPARFVSEKMPAFLYSRLADLSMLILSLDVARPALCILHNDVVPTHRAIALWCKARSVPCLHIPHAIYQDVNRGPAGTDVHDIITASHLAAAGPFQRRWYQERSSGGGRMESGENKVTSPSTLHSPLLIRETGLPQFDGLLNELKAVSRERAQRLLKMDPKRPVVTYFSTWPQHTNALGIHDEWQVSYIEFLKAVGKLQRENGVQVIVKGHPGGGQENWQWHVEAAQQVGVECAITPTHLSICLRASDLWLAYGGSNTILDAAHVEGLRLMTTHAFTDDRAVIKTGMDAEGMYEAIGDSLSKSAPPTVKLLAKYIGEPDGKASERIADWCQELLPTPKLAV